MTTEYIAASLTLLVLAFIQNISFSIVSRSRNRDNMRFHLIAAFFSNSIWFLTFRSLIKADMSLYLFPWYCAGTMLGSVFGVKISMWIERLLGASADGHVRIVQKPAVPSDLDPEEIKKAIDRIGALESIYEPEDEAGTTILSAMEARVARIENFMKIQRRDFDAEG